LAEGGLSPGTKEEKKGKFVSPAKKGREREGKDRKERKEKGEREKL
jgi:hypothetical protein